MCLGKSVKEKFDTFAGSPSIATVAGESIDIFKKNKGSEKFFFYFFFNYVPTVLVFSRPSANECKKRFFRNSTGHTLFRCYFDFGSCIPWGRKSK